MPDLRLARMSSGPFETDALANVTPLRPIKVLVDGPDATHARALSFLLEQRGYDARAGDAEVPWADVVVLYEGDSFGDTVGRAVSLIGRSDSVRVIVATEREDAPSAPRLRFVDAACSFEELAVHIERAWADLPWAKAFNDGSKTDM